jgi:hypothetical protein
MINWPAGSGIHGKERIVASGQPNLARGSIGRRIELISNVHYIKSEHACSGRGRPATTSDTFPVTAPFRSCLAPSGRGARSGESLGRRPSIANRPSPTRTEPSSINMPIRNRWNIFHLELEWRSSKLDPEAAVRRPSEPRPDHPAEFTRHQVPNALSGAPGRGGGHR